MFSRVLNIKLCLDLLCNNLGDAEDLEAAEGQNVYLERDSVPYFTIVETIVLIAILYWNNIPSSSLFTVSYGQHIRTMILCRFVTMY